MQVMTRGLPYRLPPLVMHSVPMQHQVIQFALQPAIDGNTEICAYLVSVR
jgi:hypothetical protein